MSGIKILNSILQLLPVEANKLLYPCLKNQTEQKTSPFRILVPMNDQQSIFCHTFAIHQANPLFCYFVIFPFSYFCDFVIHIPVQLGDFRSIVVDSQYRAVFPSFLKEECKTGEKPRGEPEMKTFSRYFYTFRRFFGDNGVVSLLFLILFVIFFLVLELWELFSNGFYHKILYNSSKNRMLLISMKMLSISTEFIGT